MSVPLEQFQQQIAASGLMSADELAAWIDPLPSGMKAEHRRMKRLVALKVLSPKFVRNPDSLRRFQREVEAAARLEHPNIVIAHDADEAGGIHFLVMQYVDGSDLSTRVRQHGKLSVEQAMDCILQAARFLGRALLIESSRESFSGWPFSKWLIVARKRLPTPLRWG
jgi:hypothetical protein